MGFIENNQATQNHDEPWVTPETLIDVAHSIDADINLDVLATDMINQTYLNQVQQDMALVDTYNVSQTPSIMVDNIKLDDPFDYEQIKRAIEQKLEER
ncbi:DsbA family protein [Alkalicoccobacillus plakortidis]|uniref:DsbA family protein n=1 Tax=Alkalicoccobacillus plakortidis TaxID=444060 RepID=A0ABT0XNB7_9BACI|nr:thioredoxin domain-containing protein [Alkalicoccobacillus plakortidis]MCM2677317.1 DsbA family protein [Alkalicoccobacillus plakortidis]